ncbi:hypothetical protein EWB00_001074 [Schistosoma japonicum]|uniref:Uncharacterized protein n=1 Tax=Schistosoma japonicum TaxID=6182 RepID=A0A4Z2DGS4_SCHJA|nr:hypothetical protein EWB00_001074 [Schistosoma japonicum]
MMMTMDSSRILFSEMLTTTVNGSLCAKSLKLPSTDVNTEDNFESLHLYTLINGNSIKNLWLAHELINSENANIKDKETGNTLLHYLILSIPKLVKSFNNYNTFYENKSYPNWASAIVGLLYRLVVYGRCSVNAQNNMGNTVLHLVCLLPYTEFLAVHLIRLGADPEIKNNCGLHVYYNPDEQKAWLVKNLPGLNCGIWNAIKREDMTKIDYYLSCWCRTIANQPNGKSLFECAMSTGNYELVKHIDQARNTNELISAALALDLNYMENLLSIKIEKEKCQVNKRDRTFDPPRPLTAELAIIYGNKANKAIELLRKYGAVDEVIYYESVKHKELAFMNSAFYIQVETAKTTSDLNKAWKLIEHSSFQPNLRRHTDQATYLHYLVERYKRSKHKPHLQCGLIRLMAKLVIAGVDLQARDKFGNTVLLSAAKPSNFVDSNTSAITKESMNNKNDKEVERRNEEEGDELRNEGEILRSIENIPETIKANVDETFNETEHRVMNEECNENNLSISISDHLMFSETSAEINPYMNIPHFSDQRLISVLIQLGSDCSISCNNGYSVYHENYIPKGAYTIRRNIQTALFKTRMKYSKGLIDHPGIWSIVDRLIYCIQYHKSNDMIDYFSTELQNIIEDNLIWLRAKRSGLTVIEWIKSLWIHGGCDESTRKICQKLTDLLQHYVHLTDFCIYAMAGDIKKLKHCLALGKGHLKAQLHMRKFLVGINNHNARANFISRPLLVSVMEYSTAEVLKLIIQSGANLSEYYSETEPFGPVAFWSFKNFVGLQHTYEIIKEAPIHLRDSNGSSLFHYAVNLFHVIHPNDLNGLRWATLILSTILKRGVKIFYRDVWGHTARDLLNKPRRELMKTNNDCCKIDENFRPFEEEAPDPFELHDIIDSETGNLLTAEQLIDRQVAFLSSANHLQSMEELILYGYNYIHLANSGPPRFKSARLLAEQKGHSEMVSLLNTVDQYRLEMNEVHKTIITNDYQQFLRLVNIKKVIMSRDWRERSLLHLAVIFRRTDFVLQLIELCQELVYYQDCLGRTPLHYAICLHDNRRLFLKMVSKSGGVDKQLKDLRNISIHQYGDLFDRKIPDYQNLINKEKSIVLHELNWPNYQSWHRLSLKNVVDKEDNDNVGSGGGDDLNGEHLTTKDKYQQDNKQSIEKLTNLDNSLIFPIPSAFNAFEVKRCKSTFNWKQQTHRYG